MTADEARRINEIVQAWPAEDRAWWRELIEVAPDEAIKIAPLILMDAYPVKDDEPL